MSRLLLVALALCWGVACISGPRVTRIETVTREVDREQVSPPPLIATLMPMVQGPSFALGAVQTTSPPHHAFPLGGEATVGWGFPAIELAATGRMFFGDGGPVGGLHLSLRQQWIAGRWRYGWQAAAGVQNLRLDWHYVDTYEEKVRAVDGDWLEAGHSVHEERGTSAFASLESIGATTIDYDTRPGRLGFGMGLTWTTSNQPRARGTEVTTSYSDGSTEVVGSLPRPDEVPATIAVPSFTLSYATPLGPGFLGFAMWAAPMWGKRPYGLSLHWSSGGARPTRAEGEPIRSP